MDHSAQQENLEFITTDLIPEMVHNRCFCEPSSREFVELASVSVEPLTTRPINKNNCEIFRARVVIKFSGEAKTFPIIIKVLSAYAQDNNLAYARFLNEELFYSKMAAQYQLDIYPKCHVADMGRFGRPVIVLEDLTALGYTPAGPQLDLKQIKLCLNAITRFISRGSELKRDEFEIFREFYSKLAPTAEGKLDVESISEVMQWIKEESSSDLTYELKTILGRVPDKFDSDKYFTICHGNLTAEHVMFRYENGEPVDVKIFGWNQMRYALPGIDLQSIIDTKHEEIDGFVRSTKDTGAYSVELFKKLLYFYPFICLDEIEKICSDLFA